MTPSQALARLFFRLAMVAALALCVLALLTIRPGDDDGRRDHGDEPDPGPIAPAHEPEVAAFLSRTLETTDGGTAHDPRA